MIRVLRAGAALLLLGAGACATRNDLVAVQDNLAAIMRAEGARSDSVTRAELTRVSARLDSLTDSLGVLSGRVARHQGEMRGEIHSLGQQLITIQELTGQSQRRLQELRASMEQRASEAGVSSGADVQAGTPGPNQIFQLALDQLRRGSAGAARAGFQDIVRQYPTSDLAPDAQFYVGESFAAEGNNSAADSVYQIVSTRHPQSARAPTAMYKRALSLEASGSGAEARAVLTQIIQRYPRSDEAGLARERLGGER